MSLLSLLAETSGSIVPVSPGTVAPLDLAWQTGTPAPALGHGTAGVFIVWRRGRYGRECLVVGEAHDIAEGLAGALRNGHVTALAALGAIEVSWAAVPSMHRPGIAGWLAATLAPTLASHTAAARPVAVTLPV
jgi:hypothetical protein